MKVVILAGGYGTRIGEETGTKPKPMIEIGNRPILWHIMRHYSSYGFREFVIALGYKGHVIKQYFLDYHSLSGDMTVDLGSGSVTVRRAEAEDWLLHLIDTGLDTQTGGRVLRLRPLLGDETFMLTYGDGVSSIDIGELLAFHRRIGALATVTAVRPPARFGGFVFKGDLVAEFTEKPQISEGWINGGFMVLEPAIFDLLSGDRDVFELTVLERLAERGQLAAYRHDGFWQCMDTLRDKQLLERLWDSGQAPWARWL